MPGPTLKLPQIDAANIASRFPEPLQKPGGMAIQAILDAVGADDPMSGAYPSPAAPLITRFITGGKVNKALREQHTAKFLDAARQLFHGADLEATEKFVEEYPRTAAHAKLGKLDPTKYADIAGNTDISPTKGIQITGADPGRARIPFGINPEVAAKAGWTSVPETMAHEMTHVAQGLGNKHMSELHSLAMPITGYKNNPLEIAARTTAARKLGQRLKPPTPLPKVFGELSTYPLHAASKNPETTFHSLIQSQLNGDVIRQILESRAQKKPINSFREMMDAAIERLGIARFEGP